MGSIGGSSDVNINLNATGGDKVKAEIGVPIEELKKLRQGVEDTAASTKDMAGSLETLKKVGEAWGLAEIVKEIGVAFGEANAEANRSVTTLIAVTGSLRDAKAAYAEIEEVTRSSGAQTDESVQAWVRLANVGIKPNAELLKSLQGVAVETDRDISTVAAAFAMSAEGHARGLAQLGIEAKDVGDKVLVSFQGQTQLIDKTKEGIQEYIISIGQAPAAIEAMNAKLNTSAGAWDQLKKSAGELFETLGGGGSGQVGWFTKMEQGATGYLDKLNAIIATQGILAAASVMGADHIGQFEAMAAAAQQAKEKLHDLPPELERVGDALADLLARMGGFDSSSKSITAGLSSLVAKLMTIPSEVAKQQAEVEKADTKTKEWTASLMQQAATLGMGSAALAQYRTTVGDLKDANDAVKMAAIQAGQAEDARRESIKSTAQFMQQDKSDQEYIQRLADEIAAIGQTVQYKQYLIDMTRAEKAATKEAADALRDLAQQRYADAQAKAESDLVSKTNLTDSKSIDDQIKKNQEIVDAYHKVVDAVNLVTKANDEYEKGMKALDAMLELHPEMLDQIAEAEVRLKQKRDDTISGMDKYREAEKQLLDQTSGDIGSVISDTLVNGFQDGGKKLLDLQKTIAKQMIEFWIKQKIIIPMEQQAKTAGGGTSGSMDAMTGVGMAGVAVGSAIGGQGGGALSGAASGAMIGAQYGGWYGAAIGAVIGAVAGWLGSSDKHPDYTFYGDGKKHSGQFTDDLGTFGDDTKDLSQSQISQVRAQIQQFDNAIANFLPADQVDRVKAAIDGINKRYDGADMDKILRDRMDAVVGVIAPQWKAFLDRLSGAQQMSDALQGLLNIQTELKNFNDVIVKISGSPVDQVVNQFEQLDRAVTDAQGKMATAIKTQDPAAILTAEQTLKQAIVNRYQQEMQMLQQVRQSIAQLEANAYSLNFSIQQKIGALTGDLSGAIGTAHDRVTELVSQIEGSTDAADQIGLLNQFTGALDNWLSSATQAVNDALNQQINALEAQKQGVTDNLNAQLQDIENQKSAEQQRIQSASQGAQAAQQAAQDARQAQIQDLQKQLQLAQQWAQVLDKASQTINSLMTGSTNPLGPYSQLANLESIIANRVSAVRGETGDQQAKDASQLVSDLQQRLQLIQSGNLYQRSSPEYMEQYNRTLAQLAQVQGLAGGKSSQADLLQLQLTQLQSIGTSISAGNATNSVLLTQLNQRETDLKAEAQKQLDALNAKEDEAKKQAKDQIDKLNKEALDYYTWAKTTAQAAEQKRHDELVEQLKAITGGLDPDSFIAQETAREVDLLNSIDSNLSDFLAAISSQVTNAGGGAGGGGNGGGNGGGTRPIQNNVVAPPPVNIHVTTTINGTGMGSQDIADAVNSGLSDALPSIAPALRRMLKVA